jgi:hypothetical protein
LVEEVEIEVLVVGRLGIPVLPDHHDCTCACEHDPKDDPNFNLSNPKIKYFQLG